MMANIFQRVFDAVRFQHDVDRTVEILSALDDRTLRDIGVSRGDLPETVEARLRQQRDDAARKSDRCVRTLRTGYET